MLCGGLHILSATLGGAHTGAFPVFSVGVELPALGFAKPLRVVGIPTVPRGLDGIACFSFVNRFFDGNFGDRDSLGLEA